MWPAGSRTVWESGGECWTSCGHLGTFERMAVGTSTGVQNVQCPFSENSPTAWPYDLSMPTGEDKEQHALRLWFEAFDPAVVVQLTADEVVVRSTRSRRDSYAVKCQRTSDLQMDLDTALARLVDQLS
jgi:hypothetical protein